MTASQDNIRPPRVLQLVHSLKPGGTERLVIDIVSRLRTEVPMAVCCLDEAGPWAEQVTSQDVPVAALHRRSGFSPALGRHVAAAAARHQAAIIHCHHYSPFVYGCLAKLWRPRVQVMFTEHGRLAGATPSPKRRRVNRVLSRVPRAVFAVSDELKRHLVLEGFADGAIKVVHNGVIPGPPPTPEHRSRARQALGLSDSTFVMGTVARLDPVKDLGTLIRATTAVAREMPVALIVVGDGPERQSLERLAIEERMAEQIRFLGHRDDARELLPAFDVFVNSSLSEGVSLTILEAMAAGLSIVATQVGGTPEVVDSTVGRLVPSRDFAVLSRTLLELAREPGLRHVLGRAARQRVESHFSLERMVGEYRDAYFSAL